MKEKLLAKIARWEAQLDRVRLAQRPRWGESRRFAGRSAGVRLGRIDWLISHISDANEKLRQLAAKEKVMVFRGYPVLTPEFFAKLTQVWTKLGISWEHTADNDGGEKEYDLTGTEAVLVKFLVKAYRMSEGEAKKMLKGAK